MTCDISLYAIIDPRRTRGRDLGELVRAAARGGATIFQYRDKEADTRTLVENARMLVAALEPFGVPLLVNDRVDVALAAGAQGVHVGQTDMTPADVRSLIRGDMIVGLTIKNAEQARSAPIDLIDYACIGGVYDTLSKDNPSAIGIDGWQAAAAPLRERKPDLPIGAIAGIDSANAGGILKAGADGIAVISSIFMADDVEAAAAELAAIIRRNGK